MMGVPSLGRTQEPEDPLKALSDSIEAAQKPEDKTPAANAPTSVPEPITAIPNPPEREPVKPEASDAESVGAPPAPSEREKTPAAKPQKAAVSSPAPVVVPIPPALEPMEGPEKKTAKSTGPKAPKSEPQVQSKSNRPKTDENGQFVIEVRPGAHQMLLASEHLNCIRVPMQNAKVITSDQADVTVQERNIFVKVYNPLTSLFIVDESNSRLYPITLVMKNVPPATYVLLDPSYTEAEEMQKGIAWEKSQPFDARIGDLIKRLASDGGAKLSRAHPGDPKLLPNGIELTQVRVLRIGRISGVEYTARNTRGGEYPIREHDFYEPGVLAVAVDSMYRSIPPGSSIQLYVVRENGVR